MTDSSTGGYLLPTSPAPAMDTVLEDQIQAALVGITGLAGALVRPRWQPTPPKQPAADVNWCAFGVTNNRPDSYGAVTHDPPGQGSDTIQRHEMIDVIASFYGPAGQGYATMFSDGLLIEQNREQLAANGLKVFELGDPLAAPDLTNTTWIRRYDVSFTLRRQVDRTYAVLNILSASGEIQAQDVTHVTENDWTVQEN